ncbi:MAG: hypothetical protein LBT23_07190 [Synergistaceae bacterium]|nr:hypothetical protein [Synergistaceae bacterium]
MEIKKTATPHSRMIKNFEILQKLGKLIGQGSLICMTDKPYQISKNANAISVWDI